jgi:hypothetical protein
VATKEQEHAVRNYLLALKDPTALRDDEELRVLKDKLDATADPLERVRLHEQLRQSQQVDPAAFEDAFVKHAKAWAKAEGISPDSLRAEGVDPAVLRKAGFTVRGRGARKTARKRTTRIRVSAEEIRKAIPRGKFTTRDVAEASKASVATVRNVVQEMVQQGKLEEVKPDEAHQGPGRAPKTYRRKPKS